jgi:hypothetical protein
VLHNSEPVKPEAVNTELPQLLATVTAGAGGVNFGLVVALPSALVQPSTVCVTVYVPATGTVMDTEVSPVLHTKEPVKSEAVMTELSQLLATEIVGANGIVFGAAVPIAGKLIHPFTD